MSQHYFLTFTFLVMMLTACQGDQQPSLPTKPAVNIDEVLIGQIEEHSYPVIYSVPGTIVAKEQLQIASRISGFINQINVEEGDIVEPGMMLVELDGSQVEASIRGVKAIIGAAQAELQNAEEDVTRYRALSKTQFLAEDQLRDTVVKQIRAEAALTQAQAELEAKQNDLRYINLISSVRALVRERLRAPGDLVSTGEPILRLDVLNALALEAYIPASQMGRVSKGQEVDVFVQTDSLPLEGKVTRIVRSVDKVTRSGKVWITLPNDLGLFPGQFARAQIQLGQQMMTVVPVSAIVERAGIEGVFVIADNGLVRFRSIRAGKLWQDSRELLAGVELGQSVVLNPQARLQDEDRVKRQQ